MKVRQTSPETLVIQYETQFEKDLLSRFIHETARATVIIMGQDGEAAKHEGACADPHFYQNK